MFSEKFLQKFNINEPIFTEEILSAFSEFSRAKIFRLIDEAKKNNLLVQFCKGVYYIPKTTFWGGLSSITADEIIAKRYLCDKRNVYGIYSGITLLNDFSITTQMPAVIEVVSNNETMRCREIVLQDRKFILRKSRCVINADNYATYTVLQLFSDLENRDFLTDAAKMVLLDYISEKRITKERLFDMADSFPAKASKNLLKSGILNVIA